MLNMTLLELILLASSITSGITVTFIQKTKKYFTKSKYIPHYSFIVNILFGILFCMTFTSITFPKSLWVGFFSFIGSDSIYKSLEGKLSTLQTLRENK